MEKNNTIITKTNEKDNYIYFTKNILKKANYDILTKVILEDIHNKDLKGMVIDLREYENYLSKNQINIIKEKYEDSIGKTIFLP